MYNTFWKTAVNLLTTKFKIRQKYCNFKFINTIIADRSFRIINFQ